MSRLRIVEAADAARRRIERDLHDGAQQQLVALALDLRMLRARLKDQPEIAAMVDEISARLTTALAELREFARGIHPAILTDRGLAPAVGALADRAAVPIDVEIAIEDRLPPPVEAAAYFVVAEALTNVDRTPARRARASTSGATAGRWSWWSPTTAPAAWTSTPGSGLRGLQDRLAALGGTLAIDSPPGRGTRIEARIPSLTRAAAGRPTRGGAGALSARLCCSSCSCSRSSRAAAAPPCAAMRRSSWRAARRRPRSPASGPGRAAPVRIAVVTHGQASSPFWAIVRNGVDAAARQLDVLVSYRAPEVYSVARMEQLIGDAVAEQARRARGLPPRPGPRPLRAPRRRRRHPDHHHQLRPRGLARPRRARPRRPAGGAGGLPRRAPPDRRRGAPRAVRERCRSATRGSTPAAAGSRARCARPAGPRACCPSTTSRRRRRSGSPPPSPRGDRRAAHAQRDRRAAGHAGDARRRPQPQRDRGHVRPRPGRAGGGARRPARASRSTSSPTCRATGRS